MTWWALEQRNTVFNKNCSFFSNQHIYHLRKSHQLQKNLNHSNPAKYKLQNSFWATIQDFQRSETSKSQKVPHSLRLKCWSSAAICVETDSVRFGVITKSRGFSLLDLRNILRGIQDQQLTKVYKVYTPHRYLINMIVCSTTTQTAALI